MFSKRRPPLTILFSLIPALLFLLLIIRPPPPAAATPALAATNPHTIAFKFPNLYPQALAWDPSAQHFLAGSLRSRTIAAISDAGVVETLISDPSLPPNASIAALALDSIRRRLLAVVLTAAPLRPFAALAAYDLRSPRPRLFLAHLADADSAPRPHPSGVAVDFDGNAYVSNSAGNFIWKVSADGEASVFSRSAAFAAHPVDPEAPYPHCGLNGLAYVSKGYLLVVQSNTGKLFKVRLEDGSAMTVPLTEDLRQAHGIAIRRDGVAVVVSPVAATAWFLKSDDSWGQGVVFDKTALDGPRFPTSVAVGEEGRVYVIYGHVEEGIMGNAYREWFGIEEIRAAKESEDEAVWIFVLIGLGLAYFMFWRFQMGQLGRNMNKKTA